MLPSTAATTTDTNPSISIIEGTTFKDFFGKNQGPEYYFRFRVDFVW